MSATGNGFTEASFAWFAELAEHNTSEWFTAHRDDFERLVEEPFTHLLEDVTALLADTALQLQGGVATTFRINRDVRFGKDKSPYNTHRAGLLTPSGTKAESSGLVYVQLNATGGQLAGGLYKPQTSQLEPLRQSILSDPDRFAAMVADLAGNGYALDRSDSVKTMPRGYAEHVGHPHAEHLRLRQLVVTTHLPKSAWLDDSVADRVARFATAVGPLLTYVRSFPA